VADGAIPQVKVSSLEVDLAAKIPTSIANYKGDIIIGTDVEQGVADTLSDLQANS